MWEVVLSFPLCSRCFGAPFLLLECANVERRHSDRRSLQPSRTAWMARSRRPFTALEEFIAWYGQELRPSFTKATVSAWCTSLEARRLGSCSLIVRMSAIRGSGSRQRVAGVDEDIISRTVSSSERSTVGGRNHDFKK